MQKEEEEDRELIELLGGKIEKGKKIFLYYIIIIDKLTNKNVIKEIIKEEDEYKNNNINEKEGNNINNRNSDIIKIKDKNKNLKIKKGKHFHIIDNKLNIGNNFQPLLLKNINLKRIDYSSDRKKNNNQNYSNSFRKSELYKIISRNDTENKSKFRQELISAGNTSNSKIIIPIMRRSNSLLDGILTGKNNKQKSNNKKNNIYNKSRNDKRQELNKKYNTFINVEIGIINRKKLLDKLHKIKIEKGMMNYNVFNLKKYSNKEYNSTFKQNIFLPKLFDTTNNIRNNSSKSTNKIIANII